MSSLYLRTFKEPGVEYFNMKMECPFRGNRLERVIYIKSLSLIIFEKSGASINPAFKPPSRGKGLEINGYAIWKILTLLEKESEYKGSGKLHFNEQIIEFVAKENLFPKVP